MFFHQWRYGVGAMATVLTVCTGAFAVPLSFSIDESSSQLTMQGAFANFGTVAQNPPDNTSLTSSVSGDLLIDVDNVSTPTTIQFLGGGAVIANSGDWLPEFGGETEGTLPTNPAPANFGLFLEVTALQTEGWAAFRDMVASPISNPLPVSGNVFGSAPAIQFASGSYDFNLISGLGDSAGNDSFAGATVPNTAADGTYQVDGDLITLTMPVDTTFGGDLVIQLTGDLVATAVVPEPSAAVLAISAFGLLGGVRRRR